MATWQISYLKTLVACSIAALAGLALVLAGLYSGSGRVGLLIATLGAVAIVIFSTFATASILVLLRSFRDSRNKEDLFLFLNRSRMPDQIESGSIRSASEVRRWLGRRLFGHDLLVGDLVEIKSWNEIATTLDERGRIHQLPFMPEMLHACGRRAYVFRCMHRLFDYRKSAEMRRMDDAVLLVGATCDGAHHGGCDAFCHTIWKASWLRRVSRNLRQDLSSSKSTEPRRLPPELSHGTQSPEYSCQLTQLNASSSPASYWGPIDFLRPLVSGNVTLAAFVVGWLTALFNDVQHLRRGVGYPAFESDGIPDVDIEPFEPEIGETVKVRCSSQIRATLDDNLEHRGMGFEPDMLKHCGNCLEVQSQIRRVIDIVNGRMRKMRTPAYLLRDVHFSGERQLFNAQYEPLFWRSVWLEEEDS